MKVDGDLDRGFPPALRSEGVDVLPNRTSDRRISAPRCAGLRCLGRGGVKSEHFSGEENRMAIQFMRRAAMMVALPAFVAGASAAPAFASDSKYDDDYGNVVHITICKEVKDKKKDDYYKKDHDNSGKHDKFKMLVETGYYVDKGYVKVEDRECDYLDLKFNKYYKQVLVK